MFPEITRDEVFRIETPRLWLRWPMRGDAAALAALMAQSCREGGAAVADVNGKAVEEMIAHWRAEMEAGLGLHLALALKTGARPVVGLIHAGTARSCIGQDHRALGDEAADALRAMVDWLGVRAMPRRVPMAQQRVLPTMPALAACCLQA